MSEVRRPATHGGSCAWCGTPMPADVADARPCDKCFAAWPKCAIPVCQNKSCLRLGSIYCWPHTPGQQLEAEDLEVLEDEDTGEDCIVEDSYAR